MAFTKTPEIDTHKIVRVPATGRQTITSNTRNYTALQGRRYINCYPTRLENYDTAPKSVLVKAPYRDSVTWTWPDTNAGIDAFDTETNLFTHGSKIYKASINTGTLPTITNVATYGTTGIFVSIRRVIDYTGAGDIIVAGLFFKTATAEYFPYTYNDTTATLTVSATSIVLGSALYWVDGYVLGSYVIASGEIAIARSLFIDGYHVVAVKSNQIGNNRVYNSGLGAYNTFALSTDFFSPEIDPDNMVDMQKHKNTICIIGTKTVEFFHNAGVAVGSPFVREESLTLALGADQNIAVNGGTVSIANGDDIYLIANYPYGGTVYRIRDFKAEKISDDYIDTILNNDQDIVGLANPASATLGLVDIFGTVCLGIEFTNYLTGAKSTLVFSERDRVWFEWVNSDATGLSSTSKRIVSNFYGTSLLLDGQVVGKGTFPNYSISEAEVITSSTAKMWFLSKNPLGGVVTAELYTDLIDFDSQNIKHLKWVDSVGDYGNNTVELAWTTTPDYSNWSSLLLKDPTALGKQYPVRFRNLTQGRRFAFRQRFIGSSNIAHEGLEISYNLRTQ